MGYMPLMKQPPKAPRRIRTDGWTLPRQRQFIKMLAVTGSVDQAATNAGMSPCSAYRLRLHPEMTAFRLAWKHAMAACTSSLREVAFDRAINGTMKPIYENGAIVGREPVLNDQLLMFLLRHYDKESARNPEQAMIDSFERLVEADDPDPEQTWPDPITRIASDLNVDLSGSTDWNQNENPENRP
jgi:hypothetical protein